MYLTLINNPVNFLLLSYLLITGANSCCAYSYNPSEEGSVSYNLAHIYFDHSLKNVRATETSFHSFGSVDNYIQNRTDYLNLTSDLSLFQIKNLNDQGYYSRFDDYFLKTIYFPTDKNSNFSKWDKLDLKTLASLDTYDFLETLLITSNRAIYLPIGSSSSDSTEFIQSKIELVKSEPINTDSSLSFVTLFETTSLMTNDNRLTDNYILSAKYLNEHQLLVLRNEKRVHISRDSTSNTIIRTTLESTIYFDIITTDNQLVKSVNMSQFGDSYSGSGFKLNVYEDLIYFEKSRPYTVYVLDKELNTLFTSDEPYQDKLNLGFQGSSFTLNRRVYSMSGVTVTWSVELIGKEPIYFQNLISDLSSYEINSALINNDRYLYIIYNSAQSFMIYDLTEQKIIQNISNNSAKYKNLLQGLKQDGIWFSSPIIVKDEQVNLITGYYIEDGDDCN
jgi:hypothetical protein